MWERVYRNESKSCGSAFVFPGGKNAVSLITVKRVQNEFWRWNGQMCFVATSFDGVVSTK